MAQFQKQSFGFFSAILFLALSLSGTFARAAVWVEKETWDDSWEDKYSDWVRTSFNEDFFVKGRYSGIATDCAHAVYVARMIFAFENKLPFLIKDPTGGSVRISNRMARWDGESAINRVRKFAVYIGSMVSTKTLPNDTYPIEINRKYLRAGAVWSRVRITEDNIFRRIFGMNVDADPGHAEVVKDVSDTGVVSLIGSTVPKDVRMLLLTSSLVFMPIEKTTGFRQWKQPQDYGKPVESLKGYSLEQFSMGVAYNNGSRSLDAWTKDVQSRLQQRVESKEELIQRTVNNFCSLVTARVAVVQETEKFRKKLGDQCMSAADYDNYSTPSRDKRILDTLIAVKNAAGIGGLFGPKNIDTLYPYFEKCEALHLDEIYSMTPFSYARLINEDPMVSDPNESMLARWNLAPVAAKNCPKPQ